MSRAIRSFANLRGVKPATVLVVDDEPSARASLALFLKSEGYRPMVAANGREATAASADEIDAVVLDFSLPDIDGFEVLQHLREHHPRLPTIMVTGHASIPHAVEAMKLGAFHYISKPFDFDQLSGTLRRALASGHARLPSAVPEEADPTAVIVGKSDAIVGVRETIRKFARSGSVTVLIIGESGTGKDLAARALHAASPRAPRPFTNITCTALPTALLESELFGHERGAFTDAKSRHVGLLEQAEGGTVFLDEIGDMDAGLQAKLLRVLEEKRYRRVGGSEDISGNVRVIAATHVELPSAVRAGRFREDLYYRLAVLVVRMPALRERPEDIDDLVRHFVSRCCESVGRSPCRFTGAALDALRRHAWPGNVRELRNVVERAVVLAEGDRVDRSDILGFLHPCDTSKSDVVLPAGGLSVLSVERDLVVQALARSGGNTTQAARLLGMSRDQVRYRIRKFGLWNDDDER